MREITSHKVNGLNDALTITVIDDPGPGGASHCYQIEGSLRQTQQCGIVPDVFCQIDFQNGPIKEAGVNGISNEALLAIVEDRLACFLSGEYACRENAIALTKIQEAMMWLQMRTRDRVSRGVEGTMQK